MLLAMDIGNTNIVFGVYDDRKLVSYWRIATDRSKTADEYGLILVQLFSYEKLGLDLIDGIIISSVVPPIMYSIEHMCRKYFEIIPLVVGPGTKTGMNIRYDNPKEVGADRIVNAVAAYEKYGGPDIIIDFGTATTFCAVSEKGEYLGGAIAPGIKISSDALFEKTARLPRVEFIKPDTVIAKNTVNSIQSGLIYGYVGLVDYMVKRMTDELNSGKPHVIATGGLARLIASESETIDVIDNLLTLEGLRIIYGRNQ